MSKFSPTEALAFGWDMFKKNVPFLLMIAGILAAFQVASFIISSLFTTQPSINYYGTSTIDYDTLASSFTGASLLNFIVGIGSFIASLGIIKAIINLVDSGKGNINDVMIPFKQPKILVNYILAGLLIGAIIVIGAIPFVIIGVLTLGLGFLIGIPVLIWIGIRIGFYIYFIVDKESGPLEAIKQSWRATSGNVINLIIFYLLSTGIIILGMIALLVGLFVAVPVVMVAQAYVYRRLASGTAASAPATTETQIPAAPSPTEAAPTT